MAKVLLITHIYPPAIDGGSQAIAKIGEFITKNHQTLVLTSDCRSTDDFVTPNSPSLIHSSPGIISLPVYKNFHRLLKLFPPFHKGPLFKLIPFLKSVFIIIRYHPDLIIAGPLPTTIVIYAYFFKKITGAKLLICPCYHPNDPDFNNPLLLKIVSHADFLWCLTNYEKKLLRHPHTIVKGLGVDSDFLIDSANVNFPKNPHIVFIANFAAHKRVELLITAFNILRKKYPKISLTLLGQKTLYFPAIAHKIKPPIKTIFSPTRIQITQALDSATLLCLPSIHESFGIVFVESLARGKPVIGADTHQTSEVIKLLNGGLTFKTDNLNSLVSTIDQLIKNPQKLGRSGYAYVKNNLTWDRIGEYLCQKIGL